ncbi:unnamed protein product, partial [Porites evermanni]
PYLRIIKREAFAFVATDDKYAERALVAALSLKKVQTTKPMVLICTPGVVSISRFKNFGVFDEIEIRPELNIPQNEQNPNLLLRPWITKTFTKLNIWTLTSYTKIVYLDTDVLVLKNIDDLFQRDELSAGPEDLWPDVFNSGVLYIKLLLFLGTDQGLLNDVYGNSWRTVPIRRLPYTYNMAYSTFKIYRSAYDRYKDEVKVVHFLGTLERKPWEFIFNESTNQLEPEADVYVKKWWKLYQSLSNG